MARPISAGARVPRTRDSLENSVPTSYQLRRQEQHDQKLRDMHEQVAAGKLVIRQMTPEERKRFPPREPAPAGPQRRRPS